jgi:hypothetical protein
MFITNMIRLSDILWTETQVKNSDASKVRLSDFILPTATNTPKYNLLNEA